jgi:hypothetical protein
MQACEEKDVVNYDQPPIFDEEDQMMVMDRAAALSLFNIQYQVQIEDNTNAYPSTSSGATSTIFVEVSAHDCFASIASPISLEDRVKYDIYEYIAPLDIEVIVHQNPCENKGYITKPKESENKRELSNSTYLSLESTSTVSMRDTPLKIKN